MTGYEALRTKSAWFDISSRGKIRVTGEDHLRLLHAMSTNDIKNLAVGGGLYTFFLNDKGRILADAYVYRFPESVVLDTEPETAEVLREHLDRYIIADDVTLEDQTATLAAIALEGPSAFEDASRLNLAVPGSAYGTAAWEDGFVARASVTGAPGLRFFAPLSAIVPLTARMELADIPEAQQSEVRVVRLENGTPRFGEDISSRYLVQETRIAYAVHPNKGCYLGQEIVERVRAQGQVHRLLTPVCIEGPQAPEPGTKLVTADGQVAAEITSAAYSEALGAVAGLAYVRREALEHKPVLTVEGSSPAVMASLL